MKKSKGSKTGARGVKREGAEEALRRTEQHYRSLVQVSPKAIFVNRANRIVFANPAALKLFGVRNETELVGKSPFDVFHPDYHPMMRERIARLTTGGTVPLVEEKIVRQDGRIVEVEVLATPFEEADGTAIQVILDDISERKKSERLLQDANDRLRLAVDTAALGLYERDLLTNEVVMNDNCRSIMGLASGDLPPDVAPRSLFPADRERVLQLVARAFDPQLKEVCGADFRIVRPDGEVRWVEGRGRVVFDETKTPPQPVKFLGILQDISERKRIQEALQANELKYKESEERLRSHLENTPMAVLEMDATLTVTRWAGAAEKIFGWTASEAVGRHLRKLSLIHEQDIPIVEDLAGKLTSSAARQVIASHRNYTRDGRVIHCTWYSSVLLDRQGQTSSVMSLVLDNTARVHAEQALKLAHTELEAVNAELEKRVQERTAVLQATTEQLNDFVHTLAHDLRAPVRAQNAFATLLLDEFSPALGPVGTDYARRIAAAAEHQGHLLADLLKHVRLSQADLPLEHVNLESVLRRAEADLVLELKNREAVIETGPLSVEAFASSASIHLILLNLISNAIKFVAKGVKPRVRIWAEERGQFVRLWVEDNGIGIAPEHTHKLFGIFERLHPTSAYPGTGIGLAIVKKAAERMQGRVGVESELGRGSRFWVEVLKVPPNKN